MKAIVMALAAFATLATSAYAADGDSLSKLRLGKDCEQDVVDHAKRSCDLETRKEVCQTKNQDNCAPHKCWLQDGETSIKRDADNKAYFELTFTIDDADEWTYGVTMSDKSKCAFTVVSKNNK
jgi:hypothetical protein